MISVALGSSEQIRCGTLIGGSDWMVSIEACCREVRTTWIRRLMPALGQDREVARLSLGRWPAPTGYGASHRRARRYLVILMIRSMPNNAWSRPSCVCMKHTSTYTPGLALIVSCW